MKVTILNVDNPEEIDVAIIPNVIYNETINLNDDNYFSIYNENLLNYNLFPNYNYFQTKEITNFLYNYLHSDLVKSKIIKCNPFKTRYNENNDIFIHIRLTDVEKYNPGLNYYINTIKMLNFDNIYISSDDINHEIIKEIIQLYPNTILINEDEVKTIQFGSTCKYIILSHGSFSAVIGYLSFFSIIHYHEYESDKMWYGDMFSINRWNKYSSL